MSNFTPDDIRRLARLCRLAVAEDEIEGYLAELESVLGYFARLGELDLAEVEPLTHIGDSSVFGGVSIKSAGIKDMSDGKASGCGNRPGNHLAEDEPGRMLANDVVMGLAPGAKPPFYRVPGVLSEGCGTRGSGA